MVLHNPNNWHWVNKDARDWTKDYFSKKLTTISAEENGVSAKITKVLSVDGDVDVNQRKGKVITIFDIKVKLEYTGKNADGIEASGSITIPEVAHDTELDEYVFEISNYSDTKEKQVIRDLIRTKITPQLRDAFACFGDNLIAEHGKDIQHEQTTDPAKKTTAPISGPAPSTVNTSNVAEPKHSKGTVLNTVTLTDTFEFCTSAEQLYLTFVDPQRVMAFTRTPPQPFEPKEGGKFSLFGGNVEGVFKVLEKEKKIVQDWRLADWPKGHFSTLTLVFDQGTDSTNLRLTWNGVPVGQEDVTKRNFGEYYVRSIKSTFGYEKSFFNRISSSSTCNQNATVIKGSSWQEKLEVFGPVVSATIAIAVLAYAMFHLWR